MQSESGYHFISEYLTCQQKFYWKYIEGLEPKHQSKSLLFGDCIHKALAEYYSAKWQRVRSIERQNASIDVFGDSIKEVSDSYQSQEDYENDRVRGSILLGEYFIAMANDHLQYTDCEVEVSKELILPSGRVLTGNIDLITKNDTPVIYDHKTTGWAIALSLQSLRMSNQVTTYLALCPEAKAMCYNIIYQNKTKCAFHREIVYRTSDDIQKWINQADEVLGEISSKVGKPQDSWWRNDKSCFAYNHICEYVDLCKNGRGYMTMNNFKYREKEDK